MYCASLFFSLPMCFSPMVLFSSMVDCKNSFPPIQLQDHPTKALGKDMGQTIQSRDPLCEEVLSIFDLLGQSRVFFDDVMALFLFSILTYSYAHSQLRQSRQSGPLWPDPSVCTFCLHLQSCAFYSLRQSHRSYAQYGLPHSLFRCT